MRTAMSGFRNNLPLVKKKNHVDPAPASVEWIQKVRTDAMLKFQAVLWLLNFCVDIAISVDKSNWSYGIYWDFVNVP
jgi:hypothetical protein